MKRIGIMAILLGLGIINAYPQDSIVEIPDATFLYALIDEGVDTNGDSLISYREAAAVDTLDVSGLINVDDGIYDITGIEAFINLISLNCSSREFTKLDVSGNPKLRSLECSGYWIFRTKLTTLNVSNNTELEYLDCGSSQLSSLDLRNNKALKFLDCEVTPLNALDLTNNSALEELYCGSTKISSLDVSQNLALRYLDCSSNDSISYLDISRNTKLVYVHIDGMPALQQVCVWTIPFPPEGISVNTNESPNAYFTTECIDSNVSIPDTVFLYALIDEGIDTSGDSLISYGEAEEVISLDVSNKDISNLTGIEAFNRLEHLNCSNNSITILSVSNNIALDSLDCSVNPLTSLDVSRNTRLGVLECNKSQIVSLDIRSNENLKHIGLIDNPSLHEVCVWHEFDTSIAVTTNSPNVCFQTDCNGDCSFVTGIEENNQDGISVYPNPAHSILTIETTISDFLNVQVSSLNGQLFVNRDIVGPTHQLDLSSFESGIYFITIRSKDFVTTRKIVKL